MSLTSQHDVMWEIDDTGCQIVLSTADAARWYALHGGALRDQFRHGSFIRSHDVEGVRTILDQMRAAGLDVQRQRVRDLVPAKEHPTRPRLPWVAR